MNILPSTSVPIEIYNPPVQESDGYDPDYSSESEFNIDGKNNDENPNTSGSQSS